YFSTYLMLNLTKAVVVFLAYQAWGMDSWPTYFVAWGAEAVVACARALAVAELCRRLLGHYRGIWSLAWRVLLSCVVLIVVYATITAFSGPQKSLAQGRSAANRTMGLAVAAVILTLFVFLWLYGLPCDP